MEGHNKVTSFESTFRENNTLGQFNRGTEDNRTQNNMKLTIRDGECETLESQNHRKSTQKGEDSIHETQSI